MQEPKFTKAQLLESRTLGLPADAVEAALDREKEYTRPEAEKAVKKFLERKV